MRPARIALLAMRLSKHCVAIPRPDSCALALAQRSYLSSKKIILARIFFHPSAKNLLRSSPPVIIFAHESDRPNHQRNKPILGKPRPRHAHRVGKSQRQSHGQAKDSRIILAHREERRPILRNDFSNASSTRKPIIMK